MRNPYRTAQTPLGACPKCDPEDLATDSLLTCAMEVSIHSSGDWDSVAVL